MDLLAALDWSPIASVLRLSNKVRRALARSFCVGFVACVSPFKAAPNSRQSFMTFACLDVVQILHECSSLQSASECGSCATVWRACRVLALPATPARSLAAQVEPGSMTSDGTELCAVLAPDEFASVAVVGNGPLSAEDRRCAD